MDFSSRGMALYLPGEERIRADRDRCTGCGLCTERCPFGALSLDGGETIGVDPTRCHGCGICCAECPAKAIQLNWYEDDQILCKVEALLEGVL